MKTLAVARVLAAALAGGWWCGTTRAIRRPANPEESFGPDTVLSLWYLPKKEGTDEWPTVKYQHPFAASLRQTGFNGRIFLGVSPASAKRGKEEFAHYRITPKVIREAPCQGPMYGSPGKYKLRKTCTEDYPHLKMESTRFAYGLKWLRECEKCTGWVLYADHNDIIFQRQPFTGLTPSVEKVVYFTEELFTRTDERGHTRGIDTHFWMVRRGVKLCHSPTAAEQIDRRPMLNVGSTIGNREGMIAFLERFVEELTFNAGPNSPNITGCDPVTFPDQGVMNYLVYTGAIPYGKTMPWGKWVVNTLREPCESRKLKSASMTDFVIVSSKDCLIHNPDGSVPNLVHQYSTCFHNYVQPCIRGTFEAQWFQSTPGTKGAPTSEKKMLLENEWGRL